MARLNISVPNDLAELIERWRDRVNLSEICTTALREYLTAADSARSAGRLFQHLRPPTESERELADRYGLCTVRLSRAPVDDTSVRDEVAHVAAAQIEALLRDGLILGIAGGRQIWSVVRRLAPRSVRVQIAAIGFQQTDPVVLHAHPNTLVTLLWLLYSPRAEAHLIGSEKFNDFWLTVDARSSELPRLVIASCAPFNQSSSFAQLLPASTRDILLQKEAIGDFGGVFLNRAGSPIELPSAENSSLLPATKLQALAKSVDSTVMLVAGGGEKLQMIAATLSSGLCNYLVTDEQTARALLT